MVNKDSHRGGNPMSVALSLFTGVHGKWAELAFWAELSFWAASPPIEILWRRADGL